MLKRIMAALMAVVLMFGSVDTSLFVYAMNAEGEASEEADDVSGDEKVEEEATTEAEISAEEESPAVEFSGEEQTIESQTEELAEDAQEITTSDEDIVDGGEDVSSKAEILLVNEEAEGTEEIAEETDDSTEPDIASGSYEDVSWVIDSEGTLTVSGTGEFSSSELSGQRAPWYAYRSQIKTAEIHLSEVEDLSYMFEDCSSLTSIDLSGLNTNNATHMSGMFGNCSGLTNIDVSGFDTSSVMDMRDMFCNCSRLTNIDVSGFDTSSVTDMSYMFYNCSRFTSIDVSGFDTSSVTDMSYMFYNCSKLISIDINSFDTSKVEDMSYMFRYCSSLTSIDLCTFDTGKLDSSWNHMGSMDYMFSDCKSLTSMAIDSFDTVGKTYTMKGMFYNCNSLTSIDLSGFDTSNVTDMGWMFSGCSGLTSIDLNGFDTSSVTGMECMFSGCSSLTSIDLSSFDTSNVESMVGMFNGCSSLTSVDLGSFDTSSVTSMYYMFYNCKNLKSLDVSGFDTGIVANMSEMFYGCNSLTSLDISGFDTGIVTDMSYMFYNCSCLADLDISGFDTGIVTDMSYMFYNCSCLTDLDLSSFDTGLVTNMNYMFRNCSSLASIDISSFDTGSVTNMGGMFGGCKSLKNVDVSGLDTGNVKYMYSMFSGCSNLVNIDVSGFDTGKVTDMNSMFSGCSNLVSIDVSSFDTGKVTDMYHMFAYCSNLMGVDVSGFDTSNVTMIDTMFYNCCSLTSLDLSNFDTGNVTSMAWMFWNCENLSQIVTPVNLSLSVALPTSSSDDIWYMPDGSVITELPQGLSQSVLITKIAISQVTGISLSKTQTVYGYGDTITVDDLTVTLNYDDGDFVQAYAYSTNVDELDTNNLGERTLIVSWGDFTAQLTLSIEAKMLDEDALLVLSQDSYIYNGAAWTPEPEVTVGGQTLTAGSDYTVAYNNNIHAGIAQIEITGCGNYQGTIVGSFEIEKATAPQLKGTTVYANKDKTSNEIVMDLSSRVSSYGTLTGAVLTIEENDAVSAASVISAAVIEDQTLAISVNAGTEGDSALIKMTLSFADYEDAEWTVTVALTAKESVKISGISVSDRSYNGETYAFDGSAVLTAEDGTDLTDGLELEYSHSGTTASGENYEPTAQAPSDAGIYVLTASVPDDNDAYAGSAEYYFEITPAQLTVTALDINLCLGDEIPESYSYRVDGLLDSEMLVMEPSFRCAATDTGFTATYVISPYGADAGSNYVISYVSGALRVFEEAVWYQVTFDVQGHGTAPETYIGIKSGSLIDEPEEPDATGSYTFAGWYKDAACSKVWDFANDIVESNITLYADWRMQSEADSAFSIREITDMIYTGSALKPAVRVYDGDTLLKAGKDYTVTYKNNTKANVNANAGGIGSALDDTSAGFDKSLPYVKIVGKGNYTAELYVNFRILPKSIGDGDGVAGDVTLKYSNQLVTNAKKAQAAFTSIKYKKTMKAGTDYLLTLKDESGNIMDNAKVPAGGSGTYTLRVEGIGNYTGYVERSVYVSEKTALMKNATITLGKSIKTMTYTGEAIELTPAYYDSAAKKYYTEDSSEPLANANGVFVVKMGKTGLVCGKDYMVSYTNNTAVGTATMTLTGIGSYVGSKSVTFKIKGISLNTKNVTVETPANMVYDGSAITQNGLKLVYKDGTSDGKTLVYGEDYIISYKNNVKKGTAKMTFTMLKSAGYTGSITKNFQIAAASLENEASDVQIDIESAVYSKSGAKPGVTVTYNGTELVAGTDYSVSYKNNKKVTTDGEKKPTVTVKGKGNYKGTLSEEFSIADSPLAGVTVTVAYAVYDKKKKDTYVYKPKVTLKDGSSTLSAGTDYRIVEYHNNTQTDVTKYLDAVRDGAADDVLEELRPYVTIGAGKNGYYTGTVEVDLPIYLTKLSSSNLYIDVGSVRYTGNGVIPEVTVYYCETKAILTAAKKGDVSNARKLEADTDYVLAYTGVNAGKNKGKVVISGIAPTWGGSINQKFTINRKEIRWQ